MLTAVCGMNQGCEHKQESELNAVYLSPIPIPFFLAPNMALISAALRLSPALGQI